MQIIEDLQKYLHEDSRKPMKGWFFFHSRLNLQMKMYSKLHFLENTMYNVVSVNGKVREKKLLIVCCSRIQS